MSVPQHQNFQLDPLRNSATIGTDVHTDPGKLLFCMKTALTDQGVFHDIMYLCCV